jgi:hypothetical protein
MRQAEILFLDFVQWGFDSKGWSTITRQNYRRRVRAADEWLRGYTSRGGLFTANERALWSRTRWRIPGLEHRARRGRDAPRAAR